MKKIIKYILPLVALLFVFGSCSKEDKKDFRYIEGKGNTVRFSLNMGLRAQGDETDVDQVAALDREKKINKLYAVVYFQGDGRHYKTFECTPVAGADNTFEFDATRPESFFFYVVANPDAALVTSLKNEVATKEDLANLIATQTPGEDDQADNFLMTSDKVEVTTVASSTTAVANLVKLTRLSARYDFFNEVNDLVITKIEAPERYAQSHLFAQVNKMNELAAPVQKDYDVNLVGNETTPTDYKAHIYSYENDQRGETYFMVHATYKGKALRPFKVKFENFVIKRNYIYEVHFKSLISDAPIHDPETCPIKFDIVVKDWNVEEFASDPERPDHLKWSLAMPHMTILDSYLKDSPEEVYTVTDQEGDTYISVESYYKAPSLSIEEVVLPASRGGATQTTSTYATLTPCDASGNALAPGASHGTKDAVTGKYTAKYKLHLTAIKDIVASSSRSANRRRNNGNEPGDANPGRDGVATPKACTDDLMKIKLKAVDNFSNKSTSFVVFHGRPQLALDYLYEGYQHAKLDTPPMESDAIVIPKFIVTGKTLIAPNSGLSYISMDEIAESELSKRPYGFSRINLGNIETGQSLDADQPFVASHLPKDAAEMLNFFPPRDRARGEFYLGKHATNKKGVIEDIRPVWATNTTTTFTADYWTPGNEGKVTYAVKYRKGYNGMMQTAYRYEWKNVHPSDSLSNAQLSANIPDASLEVTAIFLGPNWNGSVEDIANPAFWQANAHNKDLFVKREFPLFGNRRHVENVYTSSDKLKYLADDNLPFVEGTSYSATYLTRSFKKNSSNPMNCRNLEGAVLNYYKGAGVCVFTPTQHLWIGQPTTFLNEKKIGTEPLVWTPAQMFFLIKNK